MKPSGRIAGDMKWHIYRYPQKPGTLMVLGSILTEPDDLESSLNYSSGIEPLKPDQIWDQTMAVRRVMKSELSKTAGGRLKAILPVNPFVGAGGGVEANRSRGLEATVEALNIRAEVIVPDAAREYMNKALPTPRVTRYVREGLFAKPLYLIVGVATCEGLLMNDQDTKERGLSADADANVALAGVEAGVGISKGSKASAGSEVEVQEECDFAYRVREFQYSRRKRAAKGGGEDWIKGAMFSSNGESREVPLTSKERDELFDEIPEFDYFEGEDEDIGEEGETLMVPDPGRNL